MRVVKIVAWLLGLAVTAVVVAAIAVALFIDPNDYKDEVARAVRDATGRELEIRGDIELSLFPWLGLETGAVTLANPPGFGDEPMLSIDHAAVRLRLLPLLGREIEADTVVITGLRLRLITDAEGRSNWADLTGAGGEPDGGGSAAGSSAAVAGALAIQGIDISDGLIVWDDRASGVRYEVADLDINTGAIRPDSPIPIAVELRFTGSDVPELTLAARTEAFVELAARSGRLENLTAQLGGAVAANLTADAIDMAHETRTLGARGVALRAEQAYGTVGVDVPELDMDLDALAAAARRVSASLQGESIDVRVALEALDVDLAQGTLTGRTMTGGGRVQDTDLELTLPALDGALASRTVHTRDMVLNARRGALQASASLPAVAFDGLAQTLSVPAFTLNAAGTELTGAIEGSALIDAPRVSGRIDGRSASLRGLLQALELETATADPNVLAAATVSAEFAASTESASLTKLEGSIDDVTFAGRIQLTRFDPPAFDAELDLGRLVLDRYLPPPATGQTVAAQDAAAAAAAPVGLGALDATARIRVEQLVMQQAGYVVHDFEISTTAKGDADAYPATVSGTLRGAALPEAIAVAARSSIALEAERLGLRELRLEARGATLAASMSTPALALNLDDGSARVDDVAAALSYAGTEAALRLGRLTLAPGGTALEAADLGGGLALAGMRTELAVPAVRGDLASGAYTISNAALQIAGPQRSAGRVVVPALAVDVSGQTFEANDLYFESDAGRIDASVSGARILETPNLSGGLRAQDFDLRRLLTDLGVDLDTADPDALRRTSIEADFDASAGAISVKPLIVTIDDTRVDGFIEQPDAASAAYRFELDVDDFDADRYTSKVAGGRRATGQRCRCHRPARGADAQRQRQRPAARRASEVSRAGDLRHRRDDGIARRPHWARSYPCQPLRRHLGRRHNGGRPRRPAARQRARAPRRCAARPGA